MADRNVQVVRGVSRKVLLQQRTGQKLLPPESVPLLQAGVCLLPLVIIGTLDTLAWIMRMNWHVRDNCYLILGGAAALTCLLLTQFGRTRLAAAGLLPLAVLPWTALACSSASSVLLSDGTEWFFNRGLATLGLLVCALWLLFRRHAHLLPLMACAVAILLFSLYGIDGWLPVDPENWITSASIWCIWLMVGLVLFSREGRPDLPFVALFLFGCSSLLRLEGGSFLNVSGLLLQKAPLLPIAAVALAAFTAAPRVETRIAALAAGSGVMLLWQHLFLPVLSGWIPLSAALAHFFVANLAVWIDVLAVLSPLLLALYHRRSFPVLQAESVHEQTQLRVSRALLHPPDYGNRGVVGVLQQADDAVDLNMLVHHR